MIICYRILMHMQERLISTRVGRDSISLESLIAGEFVIV